MKKLLIVICMALLLSGCGNSWQRIFIKRDESTKIHAIWVAFPDYNEILTGKSQQAFETEVQNMMVNLESLGINTIYLHASFYTDAIYESEYYPWSVYASGTLGKALKYDPFEIILSEATLKNIKVEAWINPLRSFRKDEITKISDKYPVKQWYNDNELRKKNLMLVDGRYYLNPGSEDVIVLIENVIEELTKNYNINGIHIDDYFYPVGVTNQDAATYRQYLVDKPDTSIDEYRVDTIDNLVKRMFLKIKNINSSLVFSISPIASIERNLTENYADVEKWITEGGYCDVIIPQIYFGFDHDLMPFEEVVKSWEQIMNKKVKIVYGLAAYKIGEDDAMAGTGRNEWIESIGILSRQFEVASKSQYYDGIALYRYYMMFYPEKRLKEQMKVELSKLKEMMK